MRLNRIFAGDPTEPRLALIQVPRFDVKLFLAGGFFFGYYALVWKLLDRTEPMPADVAQLVRDALLVLGPPIGVIVGSIYRTTNADERSAARAPLSRARGRPAQCRSVRSSSSSSAVAVVAVSRGASA